MGTFLQSERNNFNFWIYDEVVMGKCVTRRTYRNHRWQTAYGTGLCELTAERGGAVRVKSQAFIIATKDR